MELQLADQSAQRGRLGHGFGHIFNLGGSGYSFGNCLSKLFKLLGLIYIGLFVRLVRFLVRFLV